jgi:hypothetical protein
MPTGKMLHFGGARCVLLQVKQSKQKDKNLFGLLGSEFEGTVVLWYVSNSFQWTRHNIPEDLNLHVAVTSK